MARGIGFSLLESVLVVAIIAVVAAIAIPRYGSASGRYRLDLAARRVAADLTYLQGLARQASSLKTVVFDSGNDTYTLEGVVDMDRASQDYVVRLSDLRYGADLASVTFQNSSGYVSTTSLSFDMWGRPECGDLPGNPLAPLVSGSIALQAGGATRTVTIDPLTGKASVQ